MATRKKIEPKKASLKQMVDVRELEAKEKVIRLERRVKYYEDTLREAGVMLGIPVKAPSGVPLRTALFHAIGQKDGWATCGKKLCFELEGIATLIGGNPVERLRYVKDRAELLNEVLKAMQITTHPDVVKPAILQMKDKADAWDRHKANRGEEENAEPDLRAAIITQHARLVYLTRHIGNMLIGTDAHNDCFQLAAKWEREGINGGEQKNNSRG